MRLPAAVWPEMVMLTFSTLSMLRQANEWLRHFVCAGYSSLGGCIFHISLMNGPSW